MNHIHFLLLQLATIAIALLSMFIIANPTILVYILFISAGMVSLTGIQARNLIGEELR